jgi:hypothetical protein
MSISPISGPAIPSTVTPIRPVAPAPTQVVNTTDSDDDNDKPTPDVRASTPPGVGENLDIKV